MSEYISINVPDGTFRAYVARPSASPAPSIVVLQEIFGVNADLRETCDDLAAQGYLAISPDLFWRLQAGIDMTDQTDAEWKKGFALYEAFDYSRGVADILATIEVARTFAGATGKVGLLGYCLGGLMTFLATIRQGADASAIYYGAGMEKYLADAGQIRNPLIIHLGEEDEYISKDAQGAIVRAFANKNGVKVYAYPGCYHAFARHHGKHYDKDAAARANGRTAEFFKAELRGKA